ncbi:hypothetical protein E4T56_gene11955 [Termitomyces sp. T112]|nr:hypothetical protein E4T56_gene11955 [Termitomyces sp. T112]
MSVLTSSVPSVGNSESLPSTSQTSQINTSASPPLSSSQHSGTNEIPRSSQDPTPVASQQAKTSAAIAGLGDNSPVTALIASSSLSPTTNGSISMVTTTTTTTSSMSNHSTLATSQGLISKRHIGPIVGGVLGGVFGLVIIAGTMFFCCRRKRQNRSDLDLWRAKRDSNMSPSPSFKEEWSARIDFTMDEAARQTERTRSRAGSTPRLPNDGYHDTSGRQSPDTIGENTLYGEHWPSRGYSESSGETETESEHVGESPETKEEKDGLERERRRQEILERMQRVLDNSSDGFDLFTDDVRGQITVQLPVESAIRDCKWFRLQPAVLIRNTCTFVVDPGRVQTIIMTVFRIILILLVLDVWILVWILVTAEGFDSRVSTVGPIVTPTYRFNYPEPITSLVAGALDFKVSPTSVFMEKTLEVSWTASSDDNPRSFELSINCDTMNTVPLLQPTKVAQALSFPFKIPNIHPQFKLPTRCNLLAKTNSDPHDPLETIPTATFTIILSSGQSTSTTHGSTSPSPSRASQASASASGSSPDTTPNQTSQTDRTDSTASSAISTASISSESISTSQRTIPTTSQGQPPSSSGISSEGPFADSPQLTLATSGISPSMTTTPTSTASGSIFSMTTTSTANGSHAKRPIAAIVGGVLGGVFGLVIIAATILFCRRKRQNPQNLDFLPAMRDTNASPFPLLKEEWMARMEAAMDEAAKQTAKQIERVRSKTGSTPRPSNDYHNTSGRQSLDTIGDEEWYGYPGPPVDHATVLPPVPDIFHGEHLRSHSHLESSEEAGAEEAIDGLAHGFGGLTASGKPSTSGSLETDKEDVELERERRRKEILEQMRKVLDDSSDGFDSLSDNLRK